MKQFCLLLTVGLFQFHSLAQDQQVIGSIGASYSTASLQADVTVGEMIISTESDVTVDLTQGFHQPNLGSSGFDHVILGDAVNLFPNPTHGAINIELLEYDQISFNLYSSDGRVVMSGRLFKGTNQIDLSTYERGVYMLSLVENESQLKLKTYQLIKH